METLSKNGKKILCFLVRNKGLNATVLQSTDFYFEFGLEHKAINSIALDSEWVKYPKQLLGGESICVANSNYDDFIENIAKDEEIARNIKKFVLLSLQGQVKNFMQRWIKQLNSKLSKMFKKKQKKHIKINDQRLQ